MSTARELTNHLVRLLREEQGAMADFLLALADFDRKKLWRELGHASLFYYLHRELRLSKGAAQNRKTAAELIQAFPGKDALGHACPGGSAAEILERGLDLVLAQHAKRRGLVEKPRKSRGGSRSDTIPAEVKREVWRRARGQCEWRFESGERCGCRRRLEYDHIEPLALGGASTMDNVRLACRPHNLLSARQVFGDAVMDRYRAVGR